MEAIYHPSAEADIEHQVRYLIEAQAGDDKLRAFFRAVRTTKQKIETHPRTWSHVAGSRHVRKVQMPGFRMQVFYVIQDNGVPIVLEFAGPGLQPRWAERL